MALISKIKVGGTTHDISVKAGNGIAISTSGAVEVCCSSGHGLEYVNDGIAVKLASGLKFNNMGYIQIDLGSGLSQDGEGRIVVV